MQKFAKLKIKINVRLLKINWYAILFQWKPTVYIETSVISYFTAKPSRDLIVAAHQQITNEWWENALPNYEVYDSTIVLDEISRGDANAVQSRLREGISFSGFRDFAGSMDSCRYLFCLH